MSLYFSLSLWLCAAAFIVSLVLAARRRRGARLYAGVWAAGFVGLSYLSFNGTAPPLPRELPIFGIDGQKLVGGLFWFIIAYTADVVVKKSIYRRRLTSAGDSKVPRVMQYLTTALIYLVALTIIVRFIYGRPITAIIAASGAVVLIIGYSARTMLDEFFAGLAVNLNAPFEKGDLIQLNDEWAYVVDVDWRSITYLDMDQNHVVVPNTKLAAARIRNLDRPNVITRRTMYFYVEYNVPPKAVVDECNMAMKECPHIIDHPWNFTSFFAFDEKGMQYKLHFHLRHYDHWYLASDELINTIWYRFRRKGIRFGQQRHLNFMTPEDERRGLPDSPYDDANWRTLLERFEEVPMFEGMTKEDMVELAKGAHLHIVGPPERIVRAGSKRCSMYLIATGAADVFEVDTSGNETLIGTVGEYETLGLMSLLTGSPQRTTIRASSESAVWEISSESLHALFDRKPEVMEHIAKSVTRWQAEEDDAIMAIANTRAQEERIIANRTSKLTKRITGFFRRTSDDAATTKYAGY